MMAVVIEKQRVQILPNKTRTNKNKPKDYNIFLKNNAKMLKLQERFKSDAHIVFTEKVNNIALGFNDDKKAQLFNRVKLYPYGARVAKKNCFMLNQRNKIQKIATLIMSQEKKGQSIVKTGLILLTFHTKY